ncbi:MAG: four helix bundle protein [Bacteroidia bacterium]|nr:four helix bundle protein [Bacteroidia bacterium]
MERKPPKTFEDLIVWQRAHQLTQEIIRWVEKNNPVFADEIEKTALLIATGVIEGYKRKERTQKIKSLENTSVHIDCLRYLIILSKDLGVPDTESLFELIDEVARLAHSYTKALYIAQNNTIAC